MSTMVAETRITFKYLMHRTKRDLCSWLLTQIDFIDALDSFHPRAMKLMREEKGFLVIANDEPYYLKAYAWIRYHEKEKGTWSSEDETLYLSAINEYG